MKKILFSIFFAVTSFFVLHAEDYWKLCDQAWERGNYATALYYQKLDMQDETLPVNLASCNVTLAMLHWNLGQTYEAQQCMQKAIQLLRSDLGKGCEQRAEIFLQKMQQRKLPKYFTRDDGNHANGVLVFIMEIPRAVFDRKMNAIKMRYAAMGTYFSSMTNSYRLQGEMQARTARLQARQTYQKKTGDTFNPNSPPAYGSSKRAEWDMCKKIYDIFGE